MKIVDLTQTFTPEFPVYSGDPKGKFEELRTFESHGCRVSAISMSAHSGTHIDAPSHFLKDGKNISDIPAGHFFGNGILVDARDCESADFPIIDVDVLKNVKLEKHAIVLFWTAMDRYLDMNAAGTYYTRFPQMTDALAHKLVEAGIKMIGLDSPSPDSEPYPVHKILLQHGCLIIENLTNLGAVEGKKFLVAALPMKLPLDGAPARVIAGIES